MKKSKTKKPKSKSKFHKKLLKLYRLYRAYLSYLQSRGYIEQSSIQFIDAGFLSVVPLSINQFQRSVEEERYDGEFDGSDFDDNLQFFNRLIPFRLSKSPNQINVLPPDTQEQIMEFYGPTNYHDGDDWDGLTFDFDNPETGTDEDELDYVNRDGLMLMEENAVNQYDENDVDEVLFI